jgi:16S rRNA (uracil1498-N3)-methyltransferase
MVLRIESAAVTYTDGKGRMGSGTYAAGRIERGEEEVVAPPRLLTVAVAPPRESARVRFVVEKLAELGVSRLAWLMTEHTEGRAPRPEKAHAWAVGALEQSRASWLLEVVGPVRVADVSGLGTPVFAEGDGMAADALPPLTDPVVCIGPEGGFSAAEIPEGALRVQLGRTVLRVDTAAMSAAVLLRDHPLP